MGESEFPGPGLYFCHQVAAIELRVDHYPAIVKSLHWADEDATAAFAQRLASQPGLGDAFIALHGDLGAGKTTLVRHLLQAMGVQGRVKSPTYAVVESYQVAGQHILHFDFYRFNDPQEWEDAGFRELFASRGVKLAEWPEKVADRLPPADLDIHLQAQADNQRSVTLTSRTAIGRALVQGAAP